MYALDGRKSSCYPLFVIACILDEEREATIVGTYQSSIHRNGRGTYPAAKLIDGILQWDDHGKFGCAHTEGGSMPEWFSLELASTQQVTKVQLIGYSHGGDQSKDVSITIGPSKEYDANEPLCRPVIDNLHTTMTDYECTGDPKYGKYVKLSSERNWFTMCEVKVYTTGTGPATTGEGREATIEATSRTFELKYYRDISGKLPAFGRVD